MLKIGNITYVIVPLIDGEDAAILEELQRIRRSYTDETEGSQRAAVTMRQYLYTGILFNRSAALGLCTPEDIKAAAYSAQ